MTNTVWSLLPPRLKHLDSNFPTHNPPFALTWLHQHLNQSLITSLQDVPRSTGQQLQQHHRFSVCLHHLLQNPMHHHHHGGLGDTQARGVLSHSGCQREAWDGTPSSPQVSIGQQMHTFCSLLMAGPSRVMKCRPLRSHHGGHRTCTLA